MPRIFLLVAISAIVSLLGACGDDPTYNGGDSGPDTDTDTDADTDVDTKEEGVKTLGPVAQIDIFLRPA